MVSSARQAIACILLIFSAFVYARSQSVAEKGLTSTITGKVTVKGKGVPGIGVSLTLMEGPGASMTRHKAVTDEQGNYRITNVPPGKYAVSIGAAAFPPAEDAHNQKTVIVNKNETIEDVNFALMRGGVITGRVTDSDGNPLIEEEVNVIPANTQVRYSYPAFMMGRTDDRGIYRIFGLRPGRYTVAAGQDTGLGGLRGRTGYQRTFHPEATEAGNATVIELDEGAEVKNVDITVGRAIVRYSASGRIIDGETGRPLADVRYGVQMFVNPNSSSMTTGAASNSDGEFKLRNLVTGKYAVFIETPPNTEWRADPVHFEVTDHDVTGLTIKSAKGGSASGVIVLEGTNDKAVYEKLLKSQLYAHVMNDRNDRGTSPSTRINPDGSFRVGGLQAGILHLGFVYGNRLNIVRVERDGVVYPQGMEIKEAEQVTGLRVIVSEANGTIRGVVKLEKGTAPATGHFSISLRRLGENDAGPMFSGSGDSPEIDARGQFVAEGLLPGTYEVRASYAPDMHTPWRGTKQQVVVTNGAVTNVTLTIDPNAPVPTRP